MSERIRLCFQVNGVEQSLEVWPFARLLDVLRDQLHITSVKEGCGEGECGACAVLLNGRLVNSCLVPALEVAGGDVLTVEGLTAAGGPLGDSVRNGGAVQCGFCTPGMLVAASDGLARGAGAAESSIREHLAGNLCRCTGYRAIVAALKEAHDR